MQWPVPARGSAGEDHEGTERLYTARRFRTADGRARMAADTRTQSPRTPRAADYPLVLTTGRVAHQWHTMTRTAKARDLLDAEPEPFVELHARDAERFGVEDGELVLVRSRRGRATLRARVSDAVPEGVALRAVSLGRAAPAPGRGRAERRGRPAPSTRPAARPS